MLFLVGGIALAFAGIMFAVFGQYQQGFYFMTAGWLVITLSWRPAKWP
jgi:hypothetical protein